MSAIDDLNRELEAKHLSGLWTVVRGGEAYREPVSFFDPHLWRWKDVRDLLMKVGDTVGMDETVRRNVSFRNPSLRGGTTHTISLGLQLVKPREIAPAHRHTMAGIRFVIAGGGAQTTVDGEPFPMERGDLITTPTRTWHDHFNGSSEPIIWLDGVDAPLMGMLRVGFHEPFEGQQQVHSKPSGYSQYELGPARPSWVFGSSVQAPPYRYRWKDTEQALKMLEEQPGDPWEGILLRFVHPLTGGFTLPTVSCEIQMLRAAETTKSHRHTSSAVYHVFRGEGFTVVGDVRFDWEAGDSFVVPFWRWHHHGSHSSNEAVLFVVNDRPVMEALGLYREEGQS